MKLRIAPSILSADFARLGEQVAEAEAAGADWIHVDVMDGHFVPNITIGPLIAAAVDRVTELPVDVHLMIEKPERYLESFREAGAELLTVHQETCPHLHRTLQQIRDLGAKAGVALNPSTPVATLREVVEMLDMILIMTVNPGFGGQKHIPSETKIREARALQDGAGRTGAHVQVDGGIGPETAARVVSAGADVLVAGSAIFRADSGIGAAVEALREAAGS